MVYKLPKNAIASGAVDTDQLRDNAVTSQKTAESFDKYPVFNPSLGTAIAADTTLNNTAINKYINCGIPANGIGYTITLPSLSGLADGTWIRFYTRNDVQAQQRIEIGPSNTNDRINNRISGAYYLEGPNASVTFVVQSGTDFATTCWRVETPSVPAINAIVGGTVSNNYIYDIIRLTGGSSLTQISYRELVVVQSDADIYNLIDNPVDGSLVTFIFLNPENQYVIRIGSNTETPLFPQLLMGSGSDLVVDTAPLSLTLIYINAGTGWRIV
jgi:hypothetical protein